VLLISGFARDGAYLKWAHADSTVGSTSLSRLLSGLSDAIDALGGGFTMNYHTAVVTVVVRSGNG
jgi:hypothetical protein